MVKKNQKGPKRLYRSKKESIFGGVCGGIGEYVNADPTIIRLLWIILTILSGGLGILVYLVAWIITPQK
jgi:phage shock protein C